MSTPYTLERTELDENWDEFVRSSPNGTVFSSVPYLNSIQQPVAVYNCYKNKERRAAVALVETADQTSTCIHDLVIYNGVMLAPPTTNQNISAIRSEQFRIMTCIADELPKIYKHVAMRLVPSIIDVRPFQWYNYGTDLPKYVPSIYYTSYVNIQELALKQKLEDIFLFTQCSYSRRQEIRYAIREHVTTHEKSETDLFIDFYRMTMERQNKTVDEDNLNVKRNIINTLIDNKLGRMFISYTANGEPGSMAFFAIDDKCSHYLFGANDPKLRDSHSGTAVLWDAFIAFSKSGIREVNLEGVNSPHRGWFKLSFGGDLRPYFTLHI